MKEPKPWMPYSIVPLQCPQEPPLGPAGGWRRSGPVRGPGFPLGLSAAGLQANSMCPRGLCGTGSAGVGFDHNSSWPEGVARFLETPDGLDFLHRLFTAAHLVFLQANDCGLRNLSWFLHLSGLDEFIAPSYGAQQAVAEEMESLLIRFGQEEDGRLAAQMPPRKITLCEDETFHPQICLVAIEPVSDFILFEQYQPQRDADTWQQCASQKLAGLPVTVCQVTSDAAKAIIAHAEAHLGAHHSPDLFHVQHDTVRATVPPWRVRRPPRCGSWKSRSRRSTSCGRMPCLPRAMPPGSSGQRTGTTHRTAGSRAGRGGRASPDLPIPAGRAQAHGKDWDATIIPSIETGRPLTAEEVGRRLTGHFDALAR